MMSGSKVHRHTDNYWYEQTPCLICGYSFDLVRVLEHPIPGVDIAEGPLVTFPSDASKEVT